MGTFNDPSSFGTKNHSPLLRGWAAEPFFSRLALHRQLKTEEMDEVHGAMAWVVSFMLVGFEDGYRYTTRNQKKHRRFQREHDDSPVSLGTLS